MSAEHIVDFFDPDTEDASDLEIREYDIVASPNDFNVLSYFNFFDTGAIKVPGFQRNYVWDIRNASKLIESILLGLPIPQIFLYEEGRNSFLVIDGQQRLLTIYWFMKGRFPKPKVRGEIRDLMTTEEGLTEENFNNDDLFRDFHLSFQRHTKSRYAGTSYESLGEDKHSFELRTIRNIVVKQVSPKEDHSSIFELFHRLNTGGTNLSQQEIRMALFHGPFMLNVLKLNKDISWRSILKGKPDSRQRDVEIILRMFALAENHEDFKTPLSKFINGYCSLHKDDEFERGPQMAMFSAFCKELSSIDRNLYLGPNSKRVSVPVLEALFVATREHAFRAGDANLALPITDSVVRAVREDPSYEEHFTGKTTDVVAVRGRIEVAKRHVG